MPTFHISGFSIVVVEKQTVKILMVRSSAVPMSSGMVGMSGKKVVPEHRPRLTVRRSQIDLKASTNLDALTDTAASGAASAAFDLSELVLDVPSSDPLDPLFDDANPLAHPDPDPAKRDWSSLHWAGDINRVAGGASLRPEFQRYSDPSGKIQASLTLHGGKIMGETPPPPASGNPLDDGANYIWNVSPTFVRAATDRLSCVSAAATTLTVSGLTTPGKPSTATIVVTPDAEVSLTNDADPTAPVVPPTMEHLKPLLQAAFDDHGSGTIALVNPIALQPPYYSGTQQEHGRRRGSDRFETGYCFSVLVRQ
jgi:hypothetical protein